MVMGSFIYSIIFLFLILTYSQASEEHIIEAQIQTTHALRQIIDAQRTIIQLQTNTINDLRQQQQMLIGCMKKDMVAEENINTTTLLIHAIYRDTVILNKEGTGHWSSDLSWAEYKNQYGRNQWSLGISPNINNENPILYLINCNHKEMIISAKYALKLNGDEFYNATMYPASAISAMSDGELMVCGSKKTTLSMSKSEFEEKTKGKQWIEVGVEITIHN